jgi:hypothetical protein
VLGAGSGKPPENGQRFVLDHERGSEEPFIYRGSVETPERSVAIEVRVHTTAESADGLQAVGSAPEASDEDRAELERLAAAMVRSALRSALKQGRRPPRRVKRWRRG